MVVLIRLLAILAMILTGVVARRRGYLDSAGTRQIAAVVTNIFYPALVYGSLVRSFTLRDLARNWASPAGTFLIMAVGAAVGVLATRLFPIAAARERHAFRFQCAINNYVFLPMPLVLMYWGDAGVALLVFSTVGSELAVWTLGVMALTGHAFDRRALRHLLSLPMAAITAAAATLVLAHVSRWTWTPGSLLTQGKDASLAVLDILGKGTVPLAMLAAGSRMAELRPSNLRRFSLGAVVVLRLVVIPACALGLLFALPFPADLRRVLVVVAVMPSAIAGVMLSDLYDADSAFAASAVLATHAAALVTIPLWLALAL
ncbi:MAG: AEC family transporter [Lentisphaeria bacterium]|nr:AEC family transporter [Lentisphaeria bacterium]